jgi:hypothetical protein
MEAIFAILHELIDHAVPMGNDRGRLHGLVSDLEPGTTAAPETAAEPGPAVPPKRAVPVPGAADVPASA